MLTQEPPQLVVPIGHEVTQLPPEHTWLPEHAMPHLPQLAPSLLVSTHLPPHAVKPASQLTSHVPLLHTAEPLAGVGHLLPQVPQLSTLVDTSMHVVPHLV